MRTINIYPLGIYNPVSISKLITTKQRSGVERYIRNAVIFMKFINNPYNHSIGFRYYKYNVRISGIRRLEILDDVIMNETQFFRARLCARKNH